MRRIVKIILIGILLVFIFGCQRKGKDAEAKPTIAIVMKTLNNPFFIEMQRGAEKAAEKLNVNLIVQAAEREVDVEKQMQIIENLIQMEVDAICITPSGSREIIPAIVKANKANIPVLVVDTKIDERSAKEAGAKIASFIGSDNVEGGRIAGEYIVKKLGGKGKVAVLEGIPGHETGDSRLKGFHQVVDNMPGIEIVSSQTANGERYLGYNVFQNILQTYPDIQALFACNDMMALGAVEAIATAKKTGEIIVIGFDAVTDARKAIQEGKMEGSIAQYSYEMGREAIENAYRLIKGEEISNYILIKIELITKENLNQSMNR